jgi:hypothetical protein
MPMTIDEHVEAHHQPEGVLRPVVVDDRLVGLVDQPLLL